MPKILKFFLYIFLPYIAINGGILFFIIQKPTITILTSESSTYSQSQIKFNVKCNIPLTKVSASIEGKDMPITKTNGNYNVTPEINGSLVISCTALNGIKTNEYYQINAFDDQPPTIDDSQTSLTASVLTLVVSDGQSGINFENIFAIDSTNKKVYPDYTNQSTGIVQFKMETKSLTVHIEDISGNSFEKTYTNTK
ncbi:MAG: hypothetical protein Q4F88_00010 [Eubacteriales bacterium]|nr:hypothetical protein [Eubacteriales bacterium]